MVPSNSWTAAITHKPSTGDYYLCMTSTSLNSSTGNNFLDLYLMESDNYSRRIEYSQLTNIQEMPLLQHGYTHIANLSEGTADKSISLILKKVVDRLNAESYNFHQVSIL